MTRDPVVALPPELAVACFEGINLKSRLSASHVSWLWRNTALSNRRLWNEYDILNTAGLVDWQSGLTAMLLRSHPAPFLLFCRGNLTGTLVKLLIQHMHRMQWLGFHHTRFDVVLRLIAEAAPMLERFTYYWYSDPRIPVTLTLTNICAPRLRDVQLAQFSITSDGEFGAMRSFSGIVTDEYLPPRPLADVFPNLVVVDLQGITQPSLAFLSSLPHSMASVTLRTIRAEPIDYTEFFRGCDRTSLSTLDINSASSIAPAVDFFDRKVHHPWEIHLRLEGHLRLCAPGVKYTIYCHDRLSFAREPALASLLHRVARLSLTLPDYAHLCQSVAWPRVFSTLAQLALDVRVQELALCVFPAGASVEAPVLKAVFLKLYGHAREPLHAIRHIPTIIRSLTGTRLADLILFAAQPQYFAEADLSGLAGLVHQVVVRRMGDERKRDYYNSNFPPFML